MPPSLVLVIAAAAVYAAFGASVPPTDPATAAPCAILEDRCQCTPDLQEFVCRTAGFTEVPHTLPYSITKLLLQCTDSRHTRGCIHSRTSRVSRNKIPALQSQKPENLGIGVKVENFNLGILSSFRHVLDLFGKAQGPPEAQPWARYT
ncbi:hypothetical protein TcasGA2_TC032826 [Tribolium castaneum]|uniref:Uncharacterized protein n=1 Tax=Tribolium castaneum TaxID=7070 RepID=A0A139WJ73_TRICA|nr:hypothetical protein TcasGA2_TC032826 [Tribolium castaneum]